jgi:hypothetical protein
VIDWGDGCHPSCVGKVPGTHRIFGGDDNIRDKGPIRAHPAGELAGGFA